VEFQTPCVPLQHDAYGLIHSPVIYLNTHKNKSDAKHVGRQKKQKHNCKSATSIRTATRLQQLQLSNTHSTPQFTTWL